MLQIHSDYATGQAPYSGAVDPATDTAFLPAPTPGKVRVPLWAGIQADGPEPLVVCHGILRRSPAPPNWLTHPETCILWTVKLTPLAMVGGEYFVQVPLFPIPEGWEVIASWSYQTIGRPLRTRAVSVEVPAETFAWGQAWPMAFQPRMTTT